MSKTTQGILAALCLSPDRWWYLSDLAHHIHRSPSSLQRPLAQLVETGILKRRADGNRVYFQVDSDCPIFSELQGLMVKTVGVVDLVRDYLQRFSSKISISFIYGSVAESKAKSGSDIDLMVIGDLGLSEISLPLRKLEKDLGREVNIKIYSMSEFQNKYETKNHFVRAIMTATKIFVFGSENELAEMVK